MHITHKQFALSGILDKFQRDVRIGKAWVALQKLNTIWNSNLPKNLKLAFFHTTVNSVLL